MTPQPSVVDAVAEQHLQQLRIDVVAVLGDVAALAALVDALTDTTQRRLGFLTPTVLAALDEQARKELRDRLDAQRNGRPTGTGDVAAPGNFAGIATATEIWATLQHQVRRCSKHLTARRVCSIHRLTHADEPTVADLSRVLAHQVLAVTDDQVLDEVLADLAHLEETTRRFVDAVEASTRLNAPCPHCGRSTLVVKFHDGTIRCDRDPKTSHYEPCVCPDPICGCKERPTGHRHTWHRPRPGAPSPSWYALRDRLNLARTTKEI